MRSAVNVKHGQLSVRAPDGTTFEVELESGPLWVGRAVPGYRPDIVLEPDPERWIGRTHCVLEFEAGSWWLADGGTVNGTFLRRDGELSPVTERLRVRDQDVICVVGGVGVDGEPRYWELTVSDPYATRRVPQVSAAPVRRSHEPTPTVERSFLTYDAGQARLFRHEGAQRSEVLGLGPLAHRLVRYMVGRSERAGGVPVACTHAELIEAVWGERDASGTTYTAEHLRDLVFDLRKRLEPERVAGAAPRFLETVPGFGYRLVVDSPSGRDVDDHR